MREIDVPKEIRLLNDPRLISPQCFNLTPVETLHENPWFVVRNRGGYFTTEYKRTQVIILPVVDNNSIVMVRAKRPVIADTTLELPAGDAKENETPVQAASRELAEETGLEINDLPRFKMLSPISNSPNRNPKLLYIYEVDISKQEYENRKLNEEDNEIGSVECFEFDDIQKLILQGQLYVSVPLAVVSRFLLNLNRKENNQELNTKNGTFKTAIKK
jgi:8-oxo-dGTP pyrophosphatase MutT (NUDIX family)